MMQEAYERYKKFHPESTITFEEWVSIKYTTPPEVISNLQPNIPPYISDDFQIGPDGAFEHEDDLKDWDNTLMDGLEDCTNEYSPYCSECSGCGDEGCCSPLKCKQSPNGNYCGTYLNDLKFGYKMHLDIMKLIGDDEKYKKQIDELYDKNYDLIYE